MHPISLSFPPPAQMLVHIYTYMCRKYHAKAAVLSFIRGGVVFHTHARTHARTTPHHHHDDDVRLYVCIHHQLFLHRDHPSICSHEIYMYMYIRHAQVRPSLSSVFPSQWDAKSVIRMGSSPGLSSALACVGKWLSRGAVLQWRRRVSSA